MRHLDLFSGIGGFALAAKWTWGEQYQNVGHSEIEEYPCRVYHQHFPESECLGDITKIKWQEGQADIITGGFPCQPHSIAGKRKGSKDERDLWSECIRTIRGVRPRYALFENVPALLNSDNGRFFNRVLADLARIGYDAEWQIISAASVGAPHLRERIWILAYPSQDSISPRPHLAQIEVGQRSIGDVGAGNGERIHNVVYPGCEHGERQSIKGEPCGQDCETADYKGKRTQGRIFEQEQITEFGKDDEYASDPTSKGLEGSNRYKSKFPECPRRDRNERWRENWYEVATRLCRVDDGVRNRVDRLKALGNAIVPQVARVIMEQIKQSDATGF